MELTEEDLVFICGERNRSLYGRYITALNEAMRDNRIITVKTAAAFIAQLGHESGGFRYTEENLNYSASALIRVFGRYFPTQQLANEYARKPEKIANRVYANRMGNGPEESGDGWRYRGRGLIQLTGKYNYQQFSRQYPIDVVSDPDYVAQPTGAVDSAAWYWVSRDLNTPAEAGNFRRVTYLINGGYNGWEHRVQLYNRALERFKGRFDERMIFDLY